MGALPASGQVRIWVPIPLNEESSGTGKAAVPAATSAKPQSIPVGAILRLSLSKPVRTSKLHAGSELDGQLSRPVYVFDRMAIPAGSRVHLVVDSIEKEKAKQDFAERLNSALTLGLDRKYLEHVKLRSATLATPSGTTYSMHLAFLDAGEVVRIETKSDEVKVGNTTGEAMAKSAPGVGKVTSIKKNKQAVEKTLHPMASLQLEEPFPLAGIEAQLPAATTPSAEAPTTAGAGNAPPEAAGRLVLPAGTHARLLLLKQLNAAEIHAGDTFEARLLEPIRNGDRLLLPEGVVFDGKVKKVIPPRRASRPASMYLGFERCVFPGGTASTVNASLTGGEFSGSRDLNMDPEGGMHGRGPGAKQTLKTLVEAAVLQDAVDEAVELASHAAAPYVSLPIAFASLIGRHGQNVVLPQYSELEIVFDRPVTIPTPGANPGAAPESAPPSAPPGSSLR
jgi:hypothetical protein